MFELNKLDYYTPQVVAETDFDPDQYGNVWYSVKFAGDAGTHLWLAKERPVEDKAYYGHFEKTKSGKALRFKRDQEPEDAVRPSSAKSDAKQEKFLKDTSDLPYRVWKDMLPYLDAQQLLKSDNYNRQLNEYVMAQSDELLKMIEGVRGDKPIDKVKEVFGDKADNVLDGITDLEDI